MANRIGVVAALAAMLLTPACTKYAIDNQIRTKRIQEKRPFRHTIDDQIRVKRNQEKQPFSEINLDGLTTDLNASPYEHVSFDKGSKTFDLYALEQDDRGVLFQGDQIDTIRDRILERAQGRGTIIVVYVHGWKHNATPCDDNLSCFRRILRQITSDENLAAEKPKRLTRIVSGIYIGWRGLSACDNPMKQVSFYGRKSAAHRAGAAQTRELLQKLRDVRIELNKTIGEKDPKSRLVIVGHSLGAALVHSAVVTELLQDLYSAKGKVEGMEQPLPPLQGFGDLVVLVNPAFEAQLYDAFPREVRKLESKNQPFSNERPVYVIISSTGDVATHYGFPIGRFFGLLSQPLKLARGPAYWYRYLVAAGNHPRYRTHTAERRETEKDLTGTVTKSEREQSNCFMKALDDKEGIGDCSCSQPMYNTRAPAIETASMKGGQDLVYSRVVLKPSKSWHGAPFWVIKAKKTVVKDHSDIFNPTLVSLIHDLVVSADPAGLELAYQSR